jgi:hypothetical protein
MKPLMTVATIGVAIIGEWFEATTVSSLIAALSLPLSAWFVSRDLGGHGRVALRDLQCSSVVAGKRSNKGAFVTHNKGKAVIVRLNATRTCNSGFGCCCLF